MRPLLAFNPPRVDDRESQSRWIPTPAGPGGQRQGERLNPKFTELVNAFDAQRVASGVGTPVETDPSLVVVLDLAGSVQDFYKTVNKVEGLEFLAEMAGDDAEPDDDFYMTESKKGRTNKPVPHSLYLVMSNVKAIDQLLSLFKRWQEDPKTTFEHGLGKFKDVFAQLVDLRRWGPEDRVRNTGLLERWQETSTVVGQFGRPVRAEIELWYRHDQGGRAEAESRVTNIINECGGKIINRARIEEIEYHALLAELPRQQVQTVLEHGPQAIRLLTAEDVMFVSPFAPMSISSASPTDTSTTAFTSFDACGGNPRVALFDGMPFTHHDALAGRLIIDDPDDIGSDYSVTARCHGTAMASLIIHGDLSAPGDPLDRPIYVRPLMRPVETGLDQFTECVLPNTLFTDLLHRSVRRLFTESASRPPWAPSVRVINLSIGDGARPLTRMMSPVGRLLDWLSTEFNVLFVVSAGNHTGPLSITAEEATTEDDARRAVTQAIHSTQIVRGILPPGDAMNALTVGATHSDDAPDSSGSSTAWDLTLREAPTLYSATGPGVNRSVKPDLYHIGGRLLFTKPPPSSESEIALSIARTGRTGPGVQVAAPGEGGDTDRTRFDYGTSHATALVTREASLLFDILETEPDEGTLALPDALFHPLLVRALLAHACSWGDWRTAVSPQSSRKVLTPLFGYGRLDPERARGAVNRAVVIAGNEIGVDERHTYELPLPLSIRSKAEWHRFVITLAYWAPTTRGLNTYRAAKVYFNAPNIKLGEGKRINADYHAVQRGSLQHEIIDGSKTMRFGDGDTFPIHVECMRDGQKAGHIGRIRYALVVSIETAASTSSTIHDEVRAGLIRQRIQSTAQQRERVRLT